MIKKRLNKNEGLVENVSAEQLVRRDGRGVTFQTVRGGGTGGGGEGGGEGGSLPSLAGQGCLRRQHAGPDK